MSAMDDRVSVLSDPPLRDVGDAIINARAAGDFVTIDGRCRVEYDGRTTSQFGFGDRHIVLKPDGTTLVHSDEKRKPVNWQPPGAKYTAMMTEDDSLVVHSERSSPNETLDIEFTNVYAMTRIAMRDEAEFNLVGTEEDVQDHLMENPGPISEALGEEFVPLESERSVPVGSIDIFGRTESGSTVVVELKRRRVGPKSVDQLRRYVEDEADKGDHDELTGVLVAPSVTDSAREMLEEHSFVHVPFDPDDAASEIGVQLNKQLSDF